VAAAHFYPDVFSHVPTGKVADACMLKAIHTHDQEYRPAAESKSKEVVARLKAMKPKSAAELVEQKSGETLTYYSYPSPPPLGFSPFSPGLPGQFSGMAGQFEPVSGHTGKITVQPAGVGGAGEYTDDRGLFAA
jgi:hypothetical protein